MRCWPILLLLTSCCFRPPGASEASLKDSEGELRDEIKHLESQVAPLRRSSEQLIQAALPPGTGMAMPGGRVGAFKVQWSGVHAGVKLTGVVGASEDDASSPASVRVVRGGR